MEEESQQKHLLWLLAVLPRQVGYLGGNGDHCTEFCYPGSCVTSLLHSEGIVLLVLLSTEALKNEPKNGV